MSIISHLLVQNSVCVCIFLYVCLDPLFGLRRTPGFYLVSFSTSPSQSLSDRKPAEGLVPLAEIGVVRVRNLAIFWQDFVHVLRPGNLHTQAQRKSHPPHTEGHSPKRAKKKGSVPSVCGGGDSQQIRRSHHDASHTSHTACHWVQMCTCQNPVSGTRLSAGF
jgi:hypothetical protein